MIIDSLGQEAKTNLKTERASFSVSADKAKKFLHIAVRNLYSNPVLASVVEVSQNAHDEHVRRGIEDKQFVVTIPTSWSPTFSVRDFGGGIPHDFMLNEYTQALESTKDSDSEMSGGWGLGRLALLSLASTYNVTTYINGVERNYSIFESENGIEIIMTHERPTTEVNGTLVSAPVPPEKVSQFRDACNRAFRYYKVKPKVNGDSSYSIVEPTYSLKGNDWGIETFHSATSAVCGIYHYPISKENIPNLTSAQADLLGNVGLVMFFGASELAPMANRQGLYYNDKTINAIKKKLNEIEIEVVKEIQKKFDECKSYFEAQLLWSKMFATSNGVNHIFKRSSQISWNGIPVTTNTVENLHKYGLVVNGEPVGHINATSYGYEWGRSRRVIKHRHNQKNFLICEKTTVFINDMTGGRGAISRAKSYIRQSVTNGKEKDACVLYFSNDIVKQEFFSKSHLTENDLVKISTIVPTKVDRNLTASERAKTKIFKWNGETDYRSSRFTKCWEISDIDLEEDEEGIYVPIERYCPVGKSCGNLDMMENVINSLVAVGCIPANTEIYGVRNGSDEHNAMKEAEEWISLDELVDEYISSYKFPESELQMIADAEEANKVGNFAFGHMIYHYGISDTVVDSILVPELKDYVSKLKNIVKVKKDCENLKLAEKHVTFTKLGGKVSVIKKPSFEISELERLLKKEIPIIDIIENPYSENDFIRIVKSLNSLLEKFSKKTLETA